MGKPSFGGCVVNPRYFTLVSLIVQRRRPKGAWQLCHLQAMGMRVFPVGLVRSDPGFILGTRPTTYHLSYNFPSELSEGRLRKKLIIELDLVTIRLETHSTIYPIQYTWL